jgi:hypothetical protein
MRITEKTKENVQQQPNSSNLSQRAHFDDLKLNLTAKLLHLKNPSDKSNIQWLKIGFQLATRAFKSISITKNT